MACCQYQPIAGKLGCVQSVACTVFKHMHRNYRFDIKVGSHLVQFCMLVIILYFVIYNWLQVPPPEKKQRKETLLSAELGKYVDKKVRVKFQGGREGMNQITPNAL